MTRLPLRYLRNPWGHSSCQSARRRETAASEIAGNGERNPGERGERHVGYPKVMPPMSSFRAIIFDMDDTLNASVAWRPAEERLYALLGQPFRPDIAAHYKGLNAMDVGKTIHASLCPVTHDAEECGRLLREYLLEEFHRGPIAPMPGADALVRALVGRYPLAVASGSPLEAVRLVLDRCGWTTCFSLAISSESVARGKPEPDVLLETARQLGCPPAEVLVIEDSLVGVRAAKRAGMTCFVTPSSDDPSIRAEADQTFATLDAMIPVLVG